MEKRHINRNRRLAAAVAAMAFAGLGYAANAAVSFELTIDSNPPGSGKTLTNAASGSDITLDVWATVTGANSNPEGMQSADLRFKSSGAILGTFAPVNQFGFTGNGSQTGTQTDLDADGDTDLGSANMADPAGWWIARSGSVVVGGWNGAVTNASGQFLLGKIKFTPTALGAGSATNLKVELRNQSNGALWFEDATSTTGTASQGTPPTVWSGDKSPPAGTAIGADVVISAAVGPITSEWTSATNGVWTNPANWSGGVPGVATPAGGDTAQFLTTGSGTHRTIALDANETIGAAVFDGVNGYSIAPVAAQTLTFDKPSGNTSITVNGTGAHDISAAVQLNKPTDISVNTGASLTLSNLNTTASGVNKTGGGVLNVDKLRTGAVSITGGKVAIIKNPNTGVSGATSGTSVVPSLAISGVGSKLDVGDHKVIVTNGGGSIATYNAMVLTGAATPGLDSNALWTGDGVNTSAPLNDPSGKLKAVGVAVNSVNTIPLTTFAGQPVGTNDILMGFTYAGDANMDGAVNLGDFALLQNNFTQTGKMWQDGDFNYDGKVDLFDFSLLQNNFGQSAATGPLPGGVSAVPEPTSLGLIGLSAIGLLRRRRNRG